MDPRFLKYYNQELKHIRESADAFARAYPKVAGRLGLETLEVGDPYVERLIESFAFLTARIQLKLDSRFPDFTQHLMQMIYPDYLAQTPSMLIAEIHPNFKDQALKDGYLVPRHTVLRGRVGPNDRTACEFRTAQDTVLWPVEISAVTYLASDSQLASDGWDCGNQHPKAGLKLTLQAKGGLRFNAIRLDQLQLFFAGPEDLPVRMLEHIHVDGIGFGVRSASGRESARYSLVPGALQASGFDDSQALLPVASRQFRGYRLLQEYFAFPARFRFLTLCGLQQYLRNLDTDQIELLIPLRKNRLELRGLINTEHFRLHSVPAINLIEKHADRITLQSGKHEYAVVVDKTRALDFEVYSIAEVSGYGSGNQVVRKFLPYYGHEDVSNKHEKAAFYVQSREPRLLSGKQKSTGTRTSYIGSETLVSVVGQEVFDDSYDVRQLGIKVLCTNRDLPLMLPIGRGTTDFEPTIGGPIDSIRCIAGPTRPHGLAVADESVWRLLSFLALNMESLLHDDGNAVELRELCRLFSRHSDDAMRSQVEAIRLLQAKPCVRQLPQDGHLIFGRGTGLELTVDETGFEGQGVFLLGQVLDHFFGRYASINSFTEFSLRSEQRGLIHRWPSRIGAKPLL
jgi:type VI secretion system protein ImpG